jgi:hypothetical protein
MKFKNAKMGIEEAKENVRGVVGKQKNPIGGCGGGTDRVAREYILSETWLSNPWSTEGVGL